MLLRLEIIISSIWQQMFSFHTKLGKKTYSREASTGMGPQVVSDFSFSVSLRALNRKWEVRMAQDAC